MTDVSTFRDAFTDALRMWEEGKDRTFILSELESSYSLERIDAQHIADLVADTYSNLTKGKSQIPGILE